MAATLFGSSSQSSNKNLVEFKAGKMKMTDKIVHPDKRKGMVYVHQADDALMHFCWKDRTTGNVEEDLIIFPDDVEYKKVKSCKNGRVFVLRFKSNNRRKFFWMQEPKTDKDDEFCRKINEYLNNPPTPGSRTGSSSLGGSDISNHQSADLSNFIGNISQQQLMQLLGSGVPSLATLLGSGSSGSGSRSSTTATSSSSSSSSSTTTTTSTSGTSASQSKEKSSSSTSESSKPSEKPIQLSDLQNILSGMGAAAAAPKPQVDLSAVMTAEALQPILSNQDFVDKLKPYLPSTGETLPSIDHLKGTVTSPQFQQAVNIFSAALQSGDLGPLISQFGLGDEAVTAATNCDMEAFVKALSKKQKEDKSDDSKKKDEDKDDDESMSTD